MLFVPISLIVISLCVIFFVVGKKYSQLVVLDVNSIAEVVEEKKKEELFKKRLEKRATETHKKWQREFGPALQKLKEIQLHFRKYVGKVEKTVVQEKDKLKSSGPKRKNLGDVHQLVKDGENLLLQSDWEGAEKKFIAVISMDSRNQDAYYGLGQVYYAQKQFKEAEDTFKFLIQINPKHLGALMKLGELSEENGKKEDAVGYYEQCVLLEDNKAIIFNKLFNLLKDIGQNEAALEAARQAVEIEPQNPKYLDNFVEISIILGNKNLAEEAFQQLRMVNPENQKLVLLKERIDNLE